MQNRPKTNRFSNWVIHRPYRLCFMVFLFYLKWRKRAAINNMINSHMDEMFTADHIAPGKGASV